VRDAAARLTCPADLEVRLQHTHCSKYLAVHCFRKLGGEFGFDKTLQAPSALLDIVSFINFQDSLENQQRP
jgi:hypothetical protein